MRYLWVFVADMALKRAAGGMFSSTYHFTKNRTLGFIVGFWCFAFTAFACIMGMFPHDVEPYSGAWTFQFAMNIITPLVLLGLGLIQGTAQRIGFGHGQHGIQKTLFAVIKTQNMVGCWNQ